MASTAVTFEATAAAAAPAVIADPRKDLLLNGSIDKLPMVCDSMEELILEVRKYSDHDSYFMQIFPLFLDRVFGENVMGNTFESSWVRGDRGGWLRKAAESTRMSSSLANNRNLDITKSRRIERTNAYSTQYGMTDFASRLLHLFVVPEGSVSKMINDDHYHHHVLSASFDILPQKVKMKLQGSIAYNCIHSPTNHAMYDHWCQRSNSITSNLMITSSPLVPTGRSNDSSNNNNIMVNLSLQNYFFVVFTRYPTVELEVFPPQHRKGTSQFIVI